MLDILKSSFLHKEFIDLGVEKVNSVFKLFDDYGSVIVSVESDSDDENFYTFKFENGNIYHIEYGTFYVFKNGYVKKLSYGSSCILKNAKRIGSISEENFIILLNTYVEHKVTESGFIHFVASKINLDNGV